MYRYDSRSRESGKYIEGGLLLLLRIITSQEAALFEKKKSYKPAGFNRVRSLVSRGK